MTRRAVLPVGVLGVVLALTGIAGTATPATGMAGGSATGRQVRPGVAPYLDLSEPGRFDQLYDAIRHDHLRAFSAGFVLGKGCTPIWDDAVPVTTDSAVSHVVTKARRLGARPIISFGGEQQHGMPRELARSCHSTRRLAAAYQSVIRRFHATEVDFDVEGDALMPSAASPAAALKASTARRFAAIRTLEHRDPHLVVSLTVPSGVHGLTPARDDPGAMALLKTAKRDRVRVDLVNLMTMDYFNGRSTEMGDAAISAARGTLPALRTVWRHESYRNIGITPMIGVNDDSTERFTLADAHHVAAWARSHRIGRLAFWSLGRDEQCPTSTSTAVSDCSGVTERALAFTRAFEG